jgi:hypothetical protein
MSDQMSLDMFICPNAGAPPITVEEIWARLVAAHFPGVIYVDHWIIFAGYESNWHFTVTTEGHASSARILPVGWRSVRWKIGKEIYAGKK